MSWSWSASCPKSTRLRGRACRDGARSLPGTGGRSFSSMRMCRRGSPRGRRFRWRRVLAPTQWRRGGEGEARAGAGELEARGENPVAGRLAATLAALRARLCRPESGGAGRRTSTCSRAALADAKFPVFLFSGHGAEAPALEMLQGLVADLNRTGACLQPASAGKRRRLGQCARRDLDDRLSAAHSFARGFPDYDPWRFDAARMFASVRPICTSGSRPSCRRRRKPGWR